MINAIVASAALLATATVVDAMGSASVVNQCSFPVSLTNVPASGGGQSQIGPQTLATGGSYSQVYTPLSNDQGWSIKLSIGNSEPLQYEYTTHSDGTIWFDLSAVNGDPFNGNWAFSATDGCQTKNTAYLYPTDDANGMQSCPDSASVTVTLCGGAGGSPAPPSGPQSAPPASASPDSSPAPDSAPAVPAPSVPAPSVPEVPAASAVPSVQSVASAAPLAAPSSADSNRWGPPGEKVGGFNQLQATPTTFDTQVAGAQTVTNVHTKVITQWVTVSPSPVAKRSEQHLHRHAERHNHF